MRELVETPNKEEFTITSRNAVKFKPSKEFKQIIIDI